MLKPIFMRSGNNYDMFEASRQSALRCEDPSLTVQSQKEEADINTIVRRFGLTGELPQGVRVPSYGDFDVVNDYRSALEALDSAKRSFAAMPSEVRRRFDNDPGAFVEFCSDSRNLEEMRKLGLAVPAKEPPPASG